MSRDEIFAEITKKASITFYTASLFFPKQIRDDVFVLYSFVRIADDYIDSNPPKIKQYQQYKLMTYRGLKGIQTGNIVVDGFCELVLRKNIKKEWIDSFFKSQELDYHKNSYCNFHELEKFIFGVAEIIGLFMAVVMNLDKKSYSAAKQLGKAMQLVNIIRDIDEDAKLNRVYLPQDELKKFNLPKKLTAEINFTNPDAFRKFINFQHQRIKILLNQSRIGLKYIPKKYYLPIVTSLDLYDWIINKINNHPEQIFIKKIKPPMRVIVYYIFINLIKLNLKFCKNEN